ncbi:LAME_0C05600g1_1 [Lachancea meyersii CBS 8951]|uniref:LAME_0C05600g1_1 n=1 Tax=Lachancea meyersii CBS 8951 TaxID=1266667 RepID=A0A1G4J1Q3_9SACH|nr:LAME_0C05600g1_1 [Lachancea meyersii CBS 8951]
MARKRNFKKGNKKTFGARDDSNAQKNWTELQKENEKWEKYYKDLGVIPEDQWDEFKKTCQAQLPLTFRITGSRKHAHEVLSLFEEQHLPNLTNCEFEGEIIKAPTRLPWYPENLAWQLDVSKQAIRKNEQFSKVQRFLVVENAVGNISRQEAVSMIPPIVLDVKPEHAVLDMCAAPGSKTAQMIEALHANDDEPTGFVVANDADHRRSHMLVHQLKRLNSANLVVVNHDAQFFPRIKTDKDSNQFLKFDRVLCDVPCSGDGTMRKNVNVWRDWCTGSGLGLHTVQLNILKRGLNLLKKGGKLVYSTCSMNPIENEAVVAGALRHFGDKIRLIDCQDQLPGLVRSQGITNWPVIDKNYVKKERGDEDTHASWFPPTAEEAQEFCLDRCIRVYPHQQNTGGFFITVFEKIDGEVDEQAKRANTEEQQEQLIAEKKQKVETGAATPVTAPASTKKEKLPRDANEEPFVFLDPKHPELEKCWSFYGIDDKFDKSSCLVRNAAGEPTRVIYYASSSLRNIIEANDDRLKLIYSGVKLFVSQRSDIECSWRIQNESLQIMKHHMNRNRVVDVNMDCFKMLLMESFPRFEDMEKSHIDDYFLSKMKTLSAGCAFINVERGDDKESMFLPLWNGSKCVNLMVCKENTQELLHRLFGDEAALKQAAAAKENQKAATSSEEVKPKSEEVESKSEEASAQVAEDAAPTTEATS